MGVKRAMEQALAIARRKTGPVYTYGPLIHNRQAVETLRARGIRAKTDFDGCEIGTILLRTHGVPPDVVRGLRAAGFEVEDGTCPHVLKGQRSIAARSAEGYEIIIVGDRDHDEVAGLIGHTAGPHHVVASVEEAQEVPLGERVLVVAQTTFNNSLFREIVDALRARKPDIEVVDSICNAATRRQHEARELATRVDAMVVVGGFHSANTKRLAEVARGAGTPTFHVETAEGLDPELLAQFETIGVTAGASTPSWITSTVIEKLRRAGEMRSLGARLRGMLAGVIIDGNLYVAAGAAALTYAATKLLELELASRWARASLMIAAFGYIFSAYALGRRAENIAGGSGLTRRSAFYQAHPRWMSVSCALLAAVSIGVLVRFGWVAVALLGLSYVTAVVYGVLISPRTGTRSAVQSRLSFLRNVPASKDLLVAAGWTMVAVFVPVVAAGGASVYAVAAIAVFVFVLAFIRSVMFDFSDVTADRLLGRDTLPALIGVVPAKAMLAILAGGLAVLLSLGSALGAFGRAAGLGYWMLLCPAYVLCYVVIFEKSITVSERRCGAAVDGGMLLAGAIALLYTILG